MDFITVGRIIVPILRVITGLCGNGGNLGGVKRASAAYIIGRAGDERAVFVTEIYRVIVYNRSASAGNHDDGGLLILLRSRSGVLVADAGGIVIQSTGTRCASAVDRTVKEGRGGIVDCVLKERFIAVVQEVYGSVHVVGDDERTELHILEGYGSLAAAKKNAPLHIDVFDYDIGSAETVADDEIAVYVRGRDSNSIARADVVAGDDDLSLTVSDRNFTADTHIRRKDIIHDLGKFLAGYVVASADGAVAVALNVMTVKESADSCLGVTVDRVAVGIVIKQFGSH